MLRDLKIFNTLTRQKERFEPITPPYVGMYVCGPTVYSDVHLGNVRTFLSFDVIYRYLSHLGYKVRYVRNITDVGHLESDADEGEDKIARKAKLENLEPMEIVQRYTLGFHKVMDLFNILPPSIEPTATGHIQEQIEMIRLLEEKNLAYAVNGSVYFNVKRYNESNRYGILSGRKIEDLLAGQRELDAQDEKTNREDFALWKKAAPGHIMKWNSPWGVGFPGWHLECSVMSTKYLGKSFDIHGGGMDLKFPHHECEIAQSIGAYHQSPAKYWMHTNMLTVNGQKMSKSLGNSFLPEELITGKHHLLNQAYSPMTVRFFMLQSHYSSTLDFSNESLKAALKGYLRLSNRLKIARGLKYGDREQEMIDQKQVDEINRLCDQCYAAMNDDFNTALAISHLFNLLKKINNLHTGSLNPAVLGEKTFNRLVDTYLIFVQDILGLKEESLENHEEILNILLDFYKEAKSQKAYDKVDLIRGKLKEIGIVLKDMKNQIDWAYEE
jgi:cysteinyl-tRNA synthetase